MEKLSYVFVAALDRVVEGRDTCGVNLIEVDSFFHEELHYWHVAMDTGNVESTSASVIDTVEVDAFIFELLELL